MYTHDPDVLALLRAMEEATDGPVALICTVSGAGTFHASVTHCYMQDGELTVRRTAFDEPLPADTRDERRRDRVISLLRRALLRARSDGKVLR